MDDPLDGAEAPYDEDPQPKIDALLNAFARARASKSAANDAAAASVLAELLLNLCGQVGALPGCVVAAALNIATLDLAAPPGDVRASDRFVKILPPEIPPASAPEPQKTPGQKPNPTGCYIEGLYLVVGYQWASNPESIDMALNRHVPSLTSASDITLDFYPDIASNQIRIQNAGSHPAWAGLNLLNVEVPPGGTSYVTASGSYRSANTPPPKPEMEVLLKHWTDDDSLCELNGVEAGLTTLEQWGPPYIEPRE